MMNEEKKKQKDLLDDLVITGGGNIVGGDNVIRVSGEVVNLHYHENNPPDIEQLKADFLSYVIHAYRTLPLRGISDFDRSYNEIFVSHIYVPLNARAELPVGETWKRIIESSPSENIVSIDNILHNQNKIVILGDPGSGKSTLLKNYTLQLASEQNSYLPILIPLNAYAESLSRDDRNLQQFLADYFSGRIQELANLEPLFTAAINNGQAIVMLDGLDECKSQLRAHLVSKIEDFTRKAVKKGNKVIVTSRIVGYRDAPLDSYNWSLYTLVDLDKESIKRISLKWFESLEMAMYSDTQKTHKSAEQNSQAFMQAINSRPDLASLASNPLMLTLLIVSMSHKTLLPLTRAELYEQYLEILISTWNNARSLDSRPVRQPLDYYQVVRVLGNLAFWLRSENPTTGVVKKERLLEWLTQYYSGSEWEKPFGEAMISATNFLETARRDSNILIERGQGYFGFIHLTIEEYLAARGLLQLDTKQSIEFIETHLGDFVWQEVFVLAIGVLKIRGQLELAKEITKKILSSGNKGIPLAEKILNDVGENVLGSELSFDIRDAVRKI